MLRATSGVQSHGSPEIPDLPKQKGYAPNTINLRLAAVRRVDYDACDSGLLSPEVGAGIRRVRRLGVRVGNWFTPAQGKLLLERSDTATLRLKLLFADDSTRGAGGLSADAAYQ